MYDERDLPLWGRVVLTVGPWAGYGVLLLLAGLLYNYKTVLFLISMFVGAFIGGGKLIVFAGAVEGAPVGIWPLAGVVVWGDLATACFLVANIDYFNRIPALGPRIAAAHAAGHRVLLAQPWMRRAAFYGMIVFIALPFQGTGSVIGVLIGRILGLTRTAIVLAVIVGSSIGALAMALLAHFGRAEVAAIAKNPWLGVATLILVLLAMWYFGRKFMGEAPPKA
jgi:hypothetical protein